MTAIKMRDPFWGTEKVHSAVLLNIEIEFGLRTDSLCFSTDEGQDEGGTRIQMRAISSLCAKA